MIRKYHDVMMLFVLLFKCDDYNGHRLCALRGFLLCEDRTPYRDNLQATLCHTGFVFSSAVFLAD